ncbi:MAG: universal stress protein, partial [Smithellaceae bacterium]
MKILVAYMGGTEIAGKVMEVAKQHAKAFGASLIVASSIERVSEKEQAVLEKVEKQLAYVKESIAAEGIDCETHILVRGLTPGEDMVDFAADRKVDEIIIGIEKKS